MTRETLMAVAAVATLTAGAAAQHNHAEHAPNGDIASAFAQSPVAVPRPADEGPHGGKLQTVGAIQVESLVAPGGLQVFAYDNQGRPIDVSQARGLATLQIVGGAKRYRYDLFPEVAEDRTASSLGVAVDLSQIAGRQVDLAYQLVGVPGAGRSGSKFTATFIVPMTETQRIAAAIEAQAVCPVSGQPLGKMGKPIPVTAGGKTVFVCCAACVDTVKSNPAKYFAAKPTLTVTASTEADAAAIARQKLCPVMDEPLGSMGAPLKVSGLGRDLFLCCKGCLKFLEKEPQKYLAKLPPLPGAETVKATEVDAQFVAAQKLCPVMDEPLDVMGGPYKTVVEGRVVYLCCPGCAKKLHANPAAYLEKLAKQGVSPPVVK